MMSGMTAWTPKPWLPGDFDMELTPRIMKMSHLLDNWRPGSGDWNWFWEQLDLRARVCVCGAQGHYQKQIKSRMDEYGAWWMTLDELEWPILGSDGRVWEGHHRIVGAIELGWKAIPVMVV